MSAYATVGISLVGIHALMDRPFFTLQVCGHLGSPEKLEDKSDNNSDTVPTYIKLMANFYSIGPSVVSIIMSMLILKNYGKVRPSNRRSAYILYSTTFLSLVM